MLSSSCQMLPLGLSFPFCQSAVGKGASRLLPSHPRCDLKSSSKMHCPQGLAGRQMLQLWTLGPEPCLRFNGL